MSRINLFIDTHVYYTFLKLQAKIWADERKKKKFLDDILQSQEDYKFYILAFVVLDDEAHFLMGMGEQEKAAAENTIWNVMVSVCRIGPEQATYICRRIADMPELLNVCRTIHFLPVKYGFAEKLNDYWWSSYQTYRGHYCWERLDTSLLLSRLSEDPEKAVLRFLNFHRRKRETFMKSVTKSENDAKIKHI